MRYFLIYCVTCGVQGTGADEPPLAGRPPGFSGAIGDFRSITTSAQPTDVQAQDPIVFSIRIVAAGTPKRIPDPLDLRQLPEFAQRFQIERLPDESVQPSQNAWEFRYQLRPLSADVSEIAALRFDYYRPGIVPPEKGYQSRYSEPIPLKVKPRPAVETAEIPAVAAFQMPDSVYELAPTPNAGPDAHLFERATAAFRAGLEARHGGNEARPHFAAAAAEYGALRQRGHHSEAVLLNEGNAYLLAGDLPQAILAYRRGLRIKPTDSVLRANLQYARSQVVPPPDTTPNSRFMLVGISKPLLFISLGGFAAACLLLVSGWSRRHRLSWTFGFAAVLLAILAGAGFLFARSYQEDMSRPVVVVASDNLLLRVGDGHLYPVRDEALLNRGVEARFLYRRGNWVQIESPGGKVGWLPRADVLLENDDEAHS